MDRLLTDCNCTYSSCSRKGRCCLCLQYHREQDELPACYFSREQEKTYDRSLHHFIASRSKASR